jgi:lysozyme family protein
MDRNFARALKLVLKEEGGFSDHPKDPGGATMKGVTLATFRRHVNSKATVDDLKHISDADLARVYKRQYWDAVKADDLPDGLDYATFDYAVNSGPGRAAKALQKVLNVAQDGKIGPATIGAAQSTFKAGAIMALCSGRMEFLRGLKTWGTFGKGWSSRVSRVQAAALDMAAHAATAAPQTLPKPSPAPVAPKPVLAPPVAIPKAGKPVAVGGTIILVIVAVATWWGELTNWIWSLFQ